MSDTSCELYWNDETLKMKAKKKYLIGRGEDCDIRLSDKFVSRRHCEISWRGDYCLVEDKNSSNGVFINDQKIEKGQIRDKDILRLGHTEIVIQIANSNDASSNPSDTMVMDKKIKNIMNEVDDRGLKGQIKELKSMFDKKKEKLSELAFKDDLTGLYNRRYFDRELEKEVSRSLRYSGPLTLLMIDIDHFKKLNDSYGHQKGDSVLAEVGKTIVSACRSMDIPCRYGGEEIALILPATDSKQGRIVGEKLRKMIADRTERFEKIKVTVSVGLAETNPLINNPAQLIKMADQCLYKAKKDGRDRVCADPK